MGRKTRNAKGEINPTCKNITGRKMEAWKRSERDDWQKDATRKCKPDLKTETKLITRLSQRLSGLTKKYSLNRHENYKLSKYSTLYKV